MGKSFQFVALSGIVIAGSVVAFFCFHTSALQEPLLRSSFVHNESGVDKPVKGAVSASVTSGAPESVKRTGFGKTANENLTMPGTDELKQNSPEKGAQENSVTNDTSAQIITGISPYPAGGKPTGPFDISWNFTNQDKVATGSITVTNLSLDAVIEVSATAFGSAKFEKPYLERNEIPRGQSRAFPVSVVTGLGRCEIIVTVTHVLHDRRGRTITINLSKEKDNRPDDTVPQPTVFPNSQGALPAAPLSGTKVIKDNAGQLIQLHESRAEK